MGRDVKIIFLLTSFIFLGTGCTKFIIKQPFGHKISRVYEADYETTWSAVVDTLKAHPIVSSDKENGIIDTDWTAGTTPLYMYRETTRFLDKEKGWDTGLIAALIMPGTVYAAYVVDGSPAHEAGIRSLDVLIDAAGKEIRTPSDLKRILSKGAGTLTIRVRRSGEAAPLAFRVSPKYGTRTYVYRPVQTRYKLDVRVTKLHEKSVEVNIFSTERGLFDQAGQQIVRSDGRLVEQSTGSSRSEYKKVESSTFREKLLLDEIGQLVNRGQVK